MLSYFNELQVNIVVCKYAAAPSQAARQSLIEVHNQK